MAQWRGCGRHYHRIKRPRPLVQARKIVAEATRGNNGHRIQKIRCAS
jgi:hypothetical protein